MSDDEKDEPETDKPEGVEPDLDDVMHTEFKRNDSGERETRETKD